MIINTGQRTDIPAFYSKWFARRIEEGYVLVRNPYYPSLVTRFTLDPKVVDVIGFCTKNPSPMFRYMDLIKDYGQFWYVTITGHDKDLEPNVPPIDKAIEYFKTLSRIVGNNAMGWRYTPIIINERYSKENHIAMFEHIASELDGFTSLATFGFLDIYPKLSKLHPELKDADDKDKIELSLALKSIAEKHGMKLRLCSKEKWLRDYGIDVDGCMRIEDYERSIGEQLIVKEKMQARKGYCACYLSNDIGAYNSCPHLCTYCYANDDKQTILDNYSKHDDESPFLIGREMPGDQVRDAKQISFKSNNLLLF